MIFGDSRQTWTRATAFVVLSVCSLSVASAQIRSESDLHAGLAKDPMRFFLARGEADACGPGCNTWISAEGQFDKGAAARFAAFVKLVDAKDLPVLLNSTGGLTDEGFAFGRFLREKKMRADVASTRPDCGQRPSSQCRAIMAAGKPLRATLSASATCSSACLFALLGAHARSVAIDGKIGVHSTAYFCFNDDGRVVQPAGRSKDAIDCRKKLTARTAELARYVAEMGVSRELMEEMDRVPSSRIRFLTREEMTRFGILTE